MSDEERWGAWFDANRALLEDAYLLDDGWRYDDALDRFDAVKLGLHSRRHPIRILGRHGACANRRSAPRGFPRVVRQPTRYC